MVSQQEIKGDSGIVGQAFLPAAIYKGLEGLPEVRLRSADALFGSLARLPGAEALPSLERAGEVADAGFSKLLASAKVGMAEHELAAEIEYAMRAMGAEDCRFMIARSSQPDIGLPPAGSATLATGEAILVVMAASYQRYWVELGQTLCLGRVSQEVVAGHKSATALFRRFAEGLTTGADPQFTNRCLEESGVSAAERRSIIAYGAGNGIGLDLVEKPLLGVDRGVTIRDGMVLTLRVCLQGRQCGSALISRPYRVTSRGLELLVSEGEELVTVAA